MGKFVAFGVGVVLAVAAYANAKKPSEEEVSKLKSCLAAVYLAQENYLDQHGTYTNKKAELSVELKKNQTLGSYCDELSLTIASASKDSFAVKAHSPKIRGSVDESKTIQVDGVKTAQADE